MRVEVVLRPVRFRGKAYGVGSVIDAGDVNSRGALLCNGCSIVDSDTPLKEVSVGESPNLEKSAKKKTTKKRGRKPKADANEEPDSEPGEFTG